MRWLLIVLAVVGIVASSLALREHYRTDLSPCSINERWDCGIVNHSPYAMLFGIPVAVIGIAGYLLLGVLAFMRAYRVMLVAAMGGLGFALHLARIESVVLGVWCIYCAISLGVISLLSLLVLGTVIVNSMSRSRQTTRSLDVLEQSKVVVATGSCRALLGLDGRGVRPHTSAALLVAQALDRVQARRSNRRHHSTQDSDDAENACRHGKAADINVQMNVSCLQVIAKGAHQRQCSHHPGDQVSDSDSCHSSREGDSQRLREKL